MTPMTDDQGRWLEAAVGLLTIGFGVISTLFWRLWNTLASKEDLEAMKRDIEEHDEHQDKEMEDRLAARVNETRTEILRLHSENSAMFKEIRDDVKSLLRYRR